MFPIQLDLWDAAGENIVEHVAAAEVIELKRADADPVILEVELDRMPSRRQRVRAPHFMRSRSTMFHRNTGLPFSR